jgi:hypothetical protein
LRLQCGHPVHVNREAIAIPFQVHAHRVALAAANHLETGRYAVSRRQLKHFAETWQ